MKITNNYYQKKKKNHKKEARVMYQIISEEEKTKSVNVLVSDIGTFLKKKKKKGCINMVVNNRRVF